MSLPCIVFPRPIPDGAVLGVCAPASPTVEPQRLEEILAHLQSKGFKVKPSPNLWKRTAYLAGTDAERAADFHTLVRDPEVQAIFALRGGYGSCRILPLIDFELVRNHPKPFLGYSDITALHQALFTRARLITFHSPNAGDSFQPGNDEPLRRMLQAEIPARGLPLFTAKSGARTSQPGRARGRLLGGNLTCLLRLLGTPYAPDFRGAILFLEDINEKAYRLDGSFTHLRLAGVFQQISGLVLGRFTGVDAEEEQRIAQFWARELPTLNFPTVTQAPIGHFIEQITVPIGAQAELDADARQLTVFPET